MNKRVLIVGLVIIGVIILLGAVYLVTRNLPTNSEGEDLETIVMDEITDEWVLNATLSDKVEKLNKVTSLKGLKEFTPDEIKQEYAIENSEGLEMAIISKLDTNEFEEIAIINIIDKDRIDEVASKIIERKVLVREQNKDNPKILELIDNNENNVIKQQGGVQFMIISKNAKQIETVIDKIF